MNTEISVFEEQEFKRLNEKHQWIINPIQKAAHNIQKSPFFSWVNSIKTSNEFGVAAKQLYFHTIDSPVSIYKNSLHNFVECNGGLLIVHNKYKERIDKIPFKHKHMYYELIRVKNT